MVKLIVIALLSQQCVDWAEIYDIGLQSQKKQLIVTQRSTRRRCLSLFFCFIFVWVFDEEGMGGDTHCRLPRIPLWLCLCQQDSSTTSQLSLMYLYLYLYLCLCQQDSSATSQLTLKPQITLNTSHQLMTKIWLVSKTKLSQKAFVFQSHGDMEEYFPILDPGSNREDDIMVQKEKSGEIVFRCTT